MGDVVGVRAVFVVARMYTLCPTRIYQLLLALVPWRIRLNQRSQLRAYSRSSLGREDWETTFAAVIQEGHIATCAMGVPVRSTSIAQKCSL